ncbi:MAG TPA: hypothetical protein DG754_03000 [Bacteroidales bacterium]|jgi:hypothetical protein|nr:hypothetical protein [Bacteroidales bacterium]
MKKAIFTLSILIVFSYTILYANNYQTDHKKTNDEQDIENMKVQFLDAEFQPGKIIFTNGITSQQNLNYHLPSNRICFINEQNEPFVLAKLNNIIVVSYGDRTFIPIDKYNIVELLEVFSDGSKLLLQRQGKAYENKDNAGPYGGSTTTSSVRELSSITINGRFSYIEATTTNKFTLSERFLLMKNGKKYTISRLKSLKKIYRSKWGEIEEYAAQNKPDFKNHQDLIELLEFCTK